MSFQTGPRFVRRSLAWLVDAGLCATMNAIQWQLRHQSNSSEELEAYLTACADLTRESYYSAPPMGTFSFDGHRIRWESPIKDHYPENNQAYAEWHGLDPRRPTVILLHALMSAHDGGYRRLARWFNERGWNAIFPHLPCHYSRVPSGHWKGALTMTANLVRNALLLQQGVIEIRQLMAWLRECGCQKFGLLGTSYGGWMGSLVSFLEPDFDFLAFLQPIVNIEHAIGQSPAAISIRRILGNKNISPTIVRKHRHLSSPLHGVPLCDRKRILLATGIYDRISPPEELEKLAQQWGSIPPLHAPQGHFGYIALSMIKKHIDGFLHRN